MESQVFINLAAKDVGKSMGFYTSMGFTNNPEFSDDSTKCMVWGDHLAGLFALSVDKLYKVNEIVDNGLSAGGSEPVPFEDYRFMQKRAIEVFDGHTWEIFCMDWSKIPTEQAS